MDTFHSVKNFSCGFYILVLNSPYFGDSRVKEFSFFSVLMDVYETWDSKPICISQENFHIHISRTKFGNIKFSTREMYELLVFRWLIRIEHYFNDPFKYIESVNIVDTRCLKLLFLFFFLYIYIRSSLLLFSSYQPSVFSRIFNEKTKKKMKTKIQILLRE